MLTIRELAKLAAEATELRDLIKDARDAASDGGEVVTKQERRRIVRKGLRFVGHLGRDLLD